MKDAPNAIIVLGNGTVFEQKLADQQSGARLPNSLTVVANTVADGERNADGGAGWLVGHMEMRDFFLYSCLVADSALFQRDGWLPVQAKEAARVAWRAPADAPDSAWQRWATGRTALPQVKSAHLGACYSGRLGRQAFALHTLAEHMSHA